MTTDPHAPVVVGVDGSAEAERAAWYGAWEARRLGVALHLVHAHHQAPLWGPTALILDRYAWDRDRVEALLDGCRRQVVDRYPDLEVRVSAPAGGPAGVLVDESTRARLVVVATGARGGVLGHLAGSVAVQVAAHAACPVIVVPGQPEQDDGPAEPGPGPVVVGVDGSEQSRRAISFAVEEAVARGTQLHAVLVWSVVNIHDTGDIVPERFDYAEEEEKADRLLDEALTGWAGRYPDLSIHRHAVHDLSPARVLTDRARDAGLVVVGSRGVGGFSGLILGSTVDSLVRRSPTPVAVVHEPA